LVGRVGKNKDDPATYGDFMEFKADVEARLAKLETDMEWIKDTLKAVKDDLGKYKWWIVVSLVVGLTGSTIFLALIKIALGG